MPFIENELKYNGAKKYAWNMKYVCYMKSRSTRRRQFFCFVVNLLLFCFCSLFVWHPAVHACARAKLVGRHCTWSYQFTLQLISNAVDGNAAATMHVDQFAYKICATETWKRRKNYNQRTISKQTTQLHLLFGFTFAI